MSQITDTGHVQSMLGQTEMVHVNQEILQRVTGLIQWGVGLLNLLICLRYLLKLMGANPSNPIAGFVYSSTQPLLSTFEDLIATLELGGTILEFHALIAIAIYGMLGWATVQLLRIMFAEIKG
jgi:uncharacterized protein YggT (Ycf19 family)